MLAASSILLSPARALKIATAGGLAFWLFLAPVLADDAAFAHWMVQGDQAAKSGDIPAALKCYSAGQQQAAGNVTNLCLLTKVYCNLMRDTASPAMQKTLAQAALASSQAAVQADSQSSLAHICVAICYAKNFPYADSRTKVNYSRSIKAECERAIALDPRQDVAYYLLARWNYGVANMNFVYKGLVRIIYGGLPAASNAAAIKDLRLAIALNPVRIIHHAELASVYTAIGQDELAHQQLEICARLKPLDPDDADARAEAVQKLSATPD